MHVNRHRGKGVIEPGPGVGIALYGRQNPRCKRHRARTRKGVIVPDYIAKLNDEVDRLARDEGNLIDVIRAMLVAVIDLDRRVSLLVGADRVTEDDPGGT